jgi:hypothetical protein
LRQANNALDNTNFRHNIVRIDVLDLQKTNWDKLGNSDFYGPSVALLDANMESISIGG